MVNFNFGLGDNANSDDGTTAKKDDGTAATTQNDNGVAPAVDAPVTEKVETPSIPNPFATEKTETPVEKPVEPAPVESIPEETKNIPEISAEKKEIETAEISEIPNPFAVPAEKTEPESKPEAAEKNPFSTDVAPILEEKIETDPTPETEKIETSEQNPFGIPAGEDTTVEMKIPEVQEKEQTPAPEPIIPATKEKSAAEIPADKNIFEKRTDEKPVPVVTTVADVPKQIAEPVATPVVPVFEPEPAPKTEKEITVNQKTEIKKEPTPAPVQKKMETQNVSVLETKKADNQQNFKNERNEDVAKNNADPLATLGKVKQEIEEYVKSHKSKIRDYQSQIVNLQKKIDEEKTALQQKQTEFAKMINEMKSLTAHFGNSGNNGNGGAQNGHKPQNNSKIIRHQNGR